MVKLTSAFFGSFINPLRQIMRSTQLHAAHCDHEFMYVEQFNNLLLPRGPRLEPFANKQHMLETVDQWPELDFLLTAGFGYRLPMAVIRKFKWVINIHPGNLQNNRGACPVAYSLLNRDSHVHLTLHLIDSEELDSGPVLLESLLPINYNRSYQDLHTRVDHLAGTMVQDTLAALSLGWSVQPVPRTYPLQSYRPKLSPDLLNDLLKATSLNEFLQQAHVAVN